MKQLYAVVWACWATVACAEDPAPPGPDPSPSSSEPPDSGTCPALDTNNCKSAFGCVSYPNAVDKLEDSCADSTFSARHGQACGYDVVESVYGEGDTLLAFYHRDSGELRGWWNKSDTLEVTCAGTVPPECAKEGGSLTGPNLCADAGNDSSTGATASSSTAVEAGPVEAGPVEAGSPEAGPIGILPDGAPIECCPISPEPDCCMSYGGSNRDGCYELCDGMPLPSDDWKLDVDENGCPVWREPPPSDRCCGCFDLPDSGSDVSSQLDSGLGDSSSMSIAADASLDASN